MTPHAMQDETHGKQSTAASIERDTAWTGQSRIGTSGIVFAARGVCLNECVTVDTDDVRSGSEERVCH
jgi:hypothetical protein